MSERTCVCVCARNVSKWTKWIIVKVNDSRKLIKRTKWKSVHCTSLHNVVWLARAEHSFVGSSEGEPFHRAHRAYGDRAVAMLTNITLLRMQFAHFVLNKFVRWLTMGRVLVYLLAPFDGSAQAMAASGSDYKNSMSVRCKTNFIEILLSPPCWHFGENSETHLFVANLLPKLKFASPSSSDTCSI